MSELTDAAVPHEAPACDGDSGDGTSGSLVRHEGTQLTARLPVDSAVREREPIRLWFEPRRLHVFDPATGRRVSERE